MSSWWWWWWWWCRTCAGATTAAPWGPSSTPSWRCSWCATCPGRGSTSTRYTWSVLSSRDGDTCNTLARPWWWARSPWARPGWWTSPTCCLPWPRQPTWPSSPPWWEHQHCIVCVLCRVRDLDIWISWLDIWESGLEYLFLEMLGRRPNWLANPSPGPWSPKVRNPVRADFVIVSSSSVLFYLLDLAQSFVIKCILYKNTLCPKLSKLRNVKYECLPCYMLELQDYAGTINPQPELRHKITTEVIKY